MNHKTENPAAWVWRAIKRHLPALLFWLAVLWITAELYAAASAYALLERGYEAIGGEAFIWLLPAAAYVLKRWAARAIQRAEPVDADYIVLPPTTTEKFAEATVKLSGVMAAAGVSAEEAAASFKAFSEAASRRGATSQPTGSSRATTRALRPFWGRRGTLEPSAPPWTHGPGTRQRYSPGTSGGPGGGGRPFPTAWSGFSGSGLIRI